MRAAALVLVLGVLPAGCDDNPPAANSEDAGATQSAASTGSDASGDEAGSTDGPALEGRAAVVDLAMFEKVGLADDPFDDRPSDVQCEFGFGFEDGLFEIETDLCNYGGFVQPSLAPIRVGDTLEFLLLHENLVSDDPDAQAHVAVALGDEVVFETLIDIPAEAAFVDPAWTSTVDAPTGTPVHVHVHNHGINSYRVADFTVVYAE